MTRAVLLGAGGVVFTRQLVTDFPRFPDLPTSLGGRVELLIP